MTPGALLADPQALSGSLLPDDCRHTYGTDTREFDVDFIVHVHATSEGSSQLPFASTTEDWMATVLLWMATNPGQDAIDVSRHFGIDLKLAVDVVGGLSEMGLLRDA